MGEWYGTINRQQRRKMQRDGLTNNDIRSIEIEKAYQKGIEDGMRQSVEMVFYMTAYTINYKLGFGNKRLTEIMYYIYNNIDAYRTGHLEKVDYEEIKKQMNKLGVKMK